MVEQLKNNVSIIYNFCYDATNHEWFKVNVTKIMNSYMLFKQTLMVHWGLFVKAEPWWSRSSQDIDHSNLSPIPTEIATKWCMSFKGSRMFLRINRDVCCCGTNLHIKLQSLSGLTWGTMEWEGRVRIEQWQSMTPMLVNHTTFLVHTCMYATRWPTEPCSLNEQLHSEHRKLMLHPHEICHWDPFEGKSY